VEPMWEYWRDKKGIVEAIEQQYPDLLQNDMRVMILVMQVKSNLQLLDNLMKSKGI
jgi:hypothetical protein